MRGASKVTLQHPQILRLPRKMNVDFTLLICFFTNLLLLYETGAITLRIYYFTKLYGAITLRIYYFTKLLLYGAITLRIYYFANL